MSDEEMIARDEIQKHLLLGRAINSIARAKTSAEIAHRREGRNAHRQADNLRTAMVAIHEMLAAFAPGGEFHSLAWPGNVKTLSAAAEHGETADDATLAMADELRKDCRALGVAI